MSGYLVIYIRYMCNVLIYTGCAELANAQLIRKIGNQGLPKNAQDSAPMLDV